MQRITNLTALVLSLITLSITNLPANAKIASSGSTNTKNVSPSSYLIAGNASRARLMDFLRRFGRSVDIQRLDTSDYRGQCVSLIARYLQEEYLGGSNQALYLGNGGDVARSVASQFSNHFNSIEDPADPITGAIISFPNHPYAQGYGHVAIVLNSRRTNSGQLQVRIVDSNGDGKAGNGARLRGRTLTINTSDFSANGYGSGISWVNPRD